MTKVPKRFLQDVARTIRDAGHRVPSLETIDSIIWPIVEDTRRLREALCGRPVTSLTIDELVELGRELQIEPEHFARVYQAAVVIEQSHDGIDASKEQSE